MHPQPFVRTTSFATNAPPQVKMVLIVSFQNSFGVPRCPTICAKKGYLSLLSTLSPPYMREREDAFPIVDLARRRKLASLKIVVIINMRREFKISLSTLESTNPILVQKRCRVDKASVDLKLFHIP
mmetsp:Transcript_8304/g.12788  ORF Transcript_8304/g.12788 Transcript_8304/m.12788 type:complete len:126 (+) Transcript_8304:1597-1974(+)